VNVYNTNADGELALAEDSPFADTGQIEASNGRYLKVENAYGARGLIVVPK
jgi:hypothetical protein